MTNVTELQSRQGRTDEKDVSSLNIGTFPDGMLRNVLEFVRPSFVQTAALCLRDGTEGCEVLLIRTLQRRHWIIPKGWPMQNSTLAEAAACEAWEEAGVRGHVSPEPIGAFTYTKVKKSGLPVQCRPLVFKLKVTEEHDTYPEAGKRTRKWVTPSVAAEMVHNPDLAALLRSL